MLTQTQANILRSGINPLITVLFIVTFALGACFVIWQVAYNQNPLESAFSTMIAKETQLP